MFTRETTKFSALSVELTKTLSKIVKKEQGIFFTPPGIVAKLIQECLSVKSPRTVLEPSCGSGEFIRYMDTVLSGVDIDAVEQNPTIFQSVSTSFETHRNPVRWEQGDFIQYSPPNGRKYDWIVGNPPYAVVSKDSVPEQYAEYIVGRPNIFGLFIVHSISMLAPDGVLAFVVPKSFLNAGYYAPIRNYMKRQGHIRKMVDFEQDGGFLDTQQSTIGFIYQKAEIVEYFGDEDVGIRRNLSPFGLRERSSTDRERSSTDRERSSTDRERSSTEFQGFTDSESAIFERNEVSHENRENDSPGFSEIEYSLRIGDNYVFSENATELRELFAGATTLKRLGLSVKTGNIVWNQKKELLTNDNTQTLLLYNSNITKENTIRMMEFKNDAKKQYIRCEGTNNMAIVVNRGNGNSAYTHTYAFMDGSTPYLVENHLNVIYSDILGVDEKRVLFERVLRSFQDARTEQFIRTFLGNNGLSKTELETVFPIFI